MNPRSQWLAASPLWDDFLSHPDAVEFRQPVLLRFASDKFMDDLQTLLAKSPAQIRERIAQPETWREPRVGVSPDWISSRGKEAQAPLSQSGNRESPPPFKIFQPVHGHFCIVAGSLTCRLPGLPDHRVKSAQGERVSLVLRRLLPKAGVTNVDGSVYDPASLDEFAWLGQGPAGVWGIAAPDGLAEGEERLPCFEMPFQNKGQARRLFAGLVPAGRRQAYTAGRQKSDNGAGDPQTADDARKIELQRQVIDPWGDLVEWYEENYEIAKDPSGVTPDVKTGVLQSSAFILLDFANYLRKYLTPLWNAVQSPAQAAGMPAAAQALYASLQTPVSSGPGLLQSLRNAKTKAAGLEDGSYAPAAADFTVLTDSTLRILIDKRADGTRLFDVQMKAAVDEAGPAVAPITRMPAMKPQAPKGDNWYILRFAYERRQCGPKSKPVMSEPSRPFQIASYFDPDAPGRAIQVALPIDTSPAALRKYDKNVAFMISDQLAKQMNRVRGLKQLMDGNVGPEVGIGMVCSFSIPIITICALLVLMIFLMLLNIIFFWLPFFKICFPVPELKAKG